MGPTEKDIANAKTLWTYLTRGKTEQHQEQRADYIIGLGGDDIHIARHCAEIYNRGMGGRLVFTGGAGGPLLRNPEKVKAQWFADEAMAMGVPKRDILVNPDGFNFRESLLVAKKTIRAEDEFDMSPRLIVVHKPYMLRMLQYIYRQEWPRAWMTVSNISNDFDEYVGMQQQDNYTKKIIGLLVSHFRIQMDYMVHYKCGVVEDIHAEVRLAFHELLGRGYTKYLVPQNPNYIITPSYGMY